MPVEPKKRQADTMRLLIQDNHKALSKDGESPKKSTVQSVFPENEYLKNIIDQQLHVHKKISDDIPQLKRWKGASKPMVPDKANTYKNQIDCFFNVLIADDKLKGVVTDIGKGKMSDVTNVLGTPTAGGSTQPGQPIFSPSGVLSAEKFLLNAKIGLVDRDELKMILECVKAAAENDMKIVDDVADAVGIAVTPANTSKPKKRRRQDDKGREKDESGTPHIKKEPTEKSEAAAEEFDEV